jgi:hypothetical protein
MKYSYTAVSFDPMDLGNHYYTSFIVVGTSVPTTSREASRFTEETLAGLQHLAPRMAPDSRRNALVEYMRHLAQMYTLHEDREVVTGKNGLPECSPYHIVTEDDQWHIVGPGREPGTKKHFMDECFQGENPALTVRMMVGCKRNAREVKGDMEVFLSERNARCHDSAGWELLCGSLQSRVRDGEHSSCWTEQGISCYQSGERVILAPWTVVKETSHGWAVQDGPYVSYVWRGE